MTTKPDDDEPSEYEGYDSNPYDLVWVFLYSAIIIGLLVALSK